MPLLVSSIQVLFINAPSSSSFSTMLKRLRPSWAILLPRRGSLRSQHGFLKWELNPFTGRSSNSWWWERYTYQAPHKDGKGKREQLKKGIKKKVTHSADTHLIRGRIR